MAYTQEDYLKALQRMRNNYQNNGNALIDTRDDSTYVGEELSSFAYMDTPTPKMVNNDLEDYKKNRNGWQRTMDTLEEGRSNVVKGALNFLDSIGDFFIGALGEVGSWFGGDSQWAEDAIQYDWVSQANESISILNPFDILSGDVFSTDYWKEYGEIFKSPKKAQEREQQLHQGSWISNTNEGFQKGYQNVTEGIGELLPSIAVAGLTGGSSLWAQAAVQGGIATVRTAGQSTETALQDGADLHGAMRYGLAKGAISGVLTSATIGIGGSVLSKSGQGVVSKLSGKIGEKIGGLFTNSSTAEVVATKVTEIFFRAGIDSSSAGAQTLIDPVIKQITYDSEAIQNAYGSDEAIQNTLANMGNAMLQAGITSAIVSSGKELTSRAKAGSFEKYKEDFYYKKHSAEIAEDATRANKYIKEYEKLYKEYKNKIGLDKGYTVSEEEFIKITNDYSKKILALENKYKINDVLEHVTDGNTYEGTISEKHADTIGKAKNNIENLINSKKNHEVEKSIVLDFMKNKGYKFNQDSNGKWSAYKETSTTNYANEQTNTEFSNGTIKINYNEKNGAATLTTPYNPSSPINIISSNNTISLSLNEPHQIAAIIEAMQHGNQSRLPDTFIYDGKKRAVSFENLRIAQKNLENKDNDLYGLKDGESALKYLNHNYSEDEIRYLNNSKSKLISNDNELKEYIYQVYNNYDKAICQAIIGRIDNKTSIRLKNDTKTDFNNFSLAYNKVYLKHIERKHITNSKENIPVTYNDLLKYPFILKNYDKAYIENGKLIITKWIDDNYQIAVEFSKKTKNLVLNSMYKIKKERNKSLPTSHDSNESLPSFTSETPSGVSSSSKNIILQNDEKNTTNIENKSLKAYNKIKKRERLDEFRRIQEESLGLHEEEISEYHGGKRTLDETLRRRLSRAYELELHSRRSGRNYTQRTLLNPKTNTNVQILENVDGQVFHDIFEINRKYLKNGELVDLHDNYDDCTCYLSEDGLSGFVITKEGDLVSVFSLSKEGGFLKTIAPIVKDKAKTLDCYASPLQDLQVMYSKIFGFKTASIMDYNMEYDHDNIAKNHDMPQVAFMVNTDNNVETKHFNKDQYDESKAYQLSFFETNDLNISPKGHDVQLVKDSANLRKDKVYSIISTTGILKNTLINLKSMLPDGAEIKLVGTKKNIIQKTFEEINLSKDITTVVDNLVNTIINSKVYIDKGTEDEKVFILKTYVDDSLKKDLFNSLYDLIEHNGSESYIKKLYENYKYIVSKLNKEIKEQKARGHFAKVYTNLKNKLPKYLKKDLEITNDNEIYHQSSLLLDPLILSSNSTNSYYDGGLKQKISDLLIKYKPIELDDNGEFKEGFSLFDENIKNEYQVLYDMLPDSKGENYSLNSAQLKQVVKLLRMISSTSKSSIDTFKTKIAPFAIETINSINSNGKMPLLKGLEARWDVIRAMLGDSSLSNEMTNLYRQKNGEATLKASLIKDKVSKYIKDNKITKILHNKIDFYGNKIPIGSLVTTYAQLLTPADYEQIDLGGLSYTNYKGKRIQGLQNLTKGKAEEIKNYLETNLPEEAKKYAIFIKDILNNELKSDYANFYKEKYGVSDANVMEDYMFLSRQIDKLSSAESLLSAPKLFGNEKTRVRKSSEAIKIVDLTDSLEKYVDNLYNQIYVMPLYRDILQVLNTKIYLNGNRTNVISAFKDKYGDKGFEILKNTMDGIAGIPRKNNAFIRLFNGWYKSTLGAKWTTIIKQNFSKFISNFTLSKITRAEIKLMFGSKEFKSILNQFEESIGEYITREKSTRTIKYESNNNFINKLDKFTDTFMIGISKMDKATIRTGLSASILSAFDNGLDSADEDFSQVVIDNFTEFVLTQINNDVLGRSELGDTNIGQIFVFQGPARVALATINNKIRLWHKYHNVSQKEIDGAISKATEEEKEAETKYLNAEQELEKAIESFENEKEKIKKNSSLSDDKKKILIEEAQKDVKEKQEKFYESSDNLHMKKASTNKARNDKRNFYRYQNMGGKKTLFSILSGLLVMGVGLTVVNELDQRIKGKKKWDEFDLDNALKQTIYNSSLSWIPIVNTVSNSVLNGYDVSLPSATMVNDLTDMLSSIYELCKGDFSDSNIKTIIRNMINGISTVSGIPFKTIYDYIVGAITQFDPVTALKIKNIFYTLNSATATKAYNEYVSENWESQAKAQLLYNSKYFKSGVIDENIANEIYVLSKYGYNVIPKNTLTSYDDVDGTRINLTKKQIEEFSLTYKESLNEVNNLLKISDYSSSNYEVQSKLIKKLYDSYYDYAKAKITGISPSNKIANILLLTNGKLGLSKFIIGINALSDITATKNVSRKELVLAQINKMSNFTKAEKLLLVYFLGFSISDKNKQTLASYLSNLGGSYKEIFNAI